MEGLFKRKWRGGLTGSLARVQMIRKRERIKCPRTRVVALTQIEGRINEGRYLIFALQTRRGRGGKGDHHIMSSEKQRGEGFKSERQKQIKCILDRTRELRRKTEKKLERKRIAKEDQREKMPNMRGVANPTKNCRKVDGEGVWTSSAPGARSPKRELHRSLVKCRASCMRKKTVAGGGS